MHTTGSDSTKEPLWTCKFCGHRKNGADKEYCRGVVDNMQCAKSRYLKPGW